MLRRRNRRGRVARDDRGRARLARRGVATALKRATIGWAIADGLEALEAGNDTDNDPMRAVNARLGYRPLPDKIVLRGPLVGGMRTDERRSRAGRPTGSDSVAAGPRGVRLAARRGPGPGLAAPYIAGGRDPDLETGRREERRYGGSCSRMVVVLVLAGFVLGSRSRSARGAP